VHGVQVAAFPHFMTLFINFGPNIGLLFWDPSGSILRSKVKSLTGHQALSDCRNVVDGPPRTANDPLINQLRLALITLLAC